MIELLQKARSHLAFLLATKGKEPQPMERLNIPDKWENFGNSSDKWVKVDLPPSEDATACLYLGKKGTVFPAHFHDSAERFYILNKSGKIRIYTKDYNDIITFPNGGYFEPKEIHLFEFLEDSKILIIWQPSFADNDWEATVYD